MVDKSEKFRWLARLGFGTRGVVYILIGYLALVTPWKTEGTRGSLEYLQDLPLGTTLLFVCAVGLLGYALFRLGSALFDFEHYGSDAKGAAHRFAHGVSGIANLVLAYAAFQFATGARQSASGDGAQAQEAAQTALSVDLGGLAIGLIGLFFLASAFDQLKKAATGDFMRRISPRAPDFVEYFGRAGYAARGAVFAVIGWSLIRSAWFSSSAEVKTLGEALGSLGDQGIVHTLIALGLLLFGLFGLFLARYRIIQDPDSLSGKAH
ncbi:DUF1206 domain-containing protein [Altericroceibacterium xinjiangense]|uniref:DUF1206 domain-containing protein n=1 Tax=Altericroceibacterium xinjiangense TaxID=762261 RepID=UPI000F7DCDAF|nr:DUF1206 domain-containing protein [Altericroceibacterium xinjiangense]